VKFYSRIFRQAFLLVVLRNGDAFQRKVREIMSDSEIVKDFLVESYENLDRLDRDLVGLEKNPHDQDALAGVFRTIHTIKGTCGFLGYNKLEKVAHVGENLLTRLRDGQLTLNPERTTALLGMVDAVRQILKEIESTGQDGENRLSRAAGNADPTPNSRCGGCRKRLWPDCTIFSACPGCLKASGEDLIFIFCKEG
jgi:HPt (histidine-containing phosphotransfer) domain-containing protein